jgi:tetratricopeptide (TPR) repeat protein
MAYARRAGDTANHADTRERPSGETLPAARAKRNVAEEIAELELVLEADPRTERFWELADAYTRAGRYQEATAICKRGLTMHASSARGFLALGRALFGIGRLNAAGGALRRAIDLGPELPEGYRLLGELLLRRGIHTEAVSLLERGLERGLEDRRLHKLHQRAVDALEAQATTVTEVPDASRGMGNVAVAGTISRAPGEDDGNDDEELEDDDDLLFRRHDEAEAGKRGLALRAFRSGENEVNGEAAGAGAWESLEAAWEARLDAQSSSRMLTDPDVAVSGKGVDIDLAPLSDPLAEGMPPLPDATSEVDLPRGVPTAQPDPVVTHSSAEVATADAARLARARAEMEANRIDDEDPEEDELDTAVVQAPNVARAASIAAIAAETMADVVDSEPVLPQDDAPPAMPDVTGEQPTLTAADELASSPPSPLPAADLAPSSRPERPDALLRSLAAAHEPTEPMVYEASTAFVEPLEQKRGGGAGRWLLIVLLLGALGAGGYLGWRYFEARQRVTQALDFAHKARRVGTAAVLKEASQRLERALSDQHVRMLRVKLGALRAERDLLRALAWLWHRSGKEPAGRTASASLWAARAAMTAVVLARGEAGAVERTLGSAPQTSDDLALHHALLATARWARGDSGGASTAIAAALKEQPKLSAATLIQAQVAHSVGRWDAAQRAYRKVLEAHPGHHQAAVGLAAVLQRRDPHHGEIGRLLEQAKGAPLATAWRQLLMVRRRLLAGDIAKRGELERRAAQAPAERDLLIFAARLLAESCAFSAADKTLARTKGLAGAKDDPAMTQLAGELALARGLPERAVTLLAKRSSPHARRLRAWALLLLGRRAEVKPLLAKDRAAEAETLRVFATGQALLAQKLGSERAAKPKQPGATAALRTQVLEPLKLLARRSPRAAFALLWLHAGQGESEAKLAARAATIVVGSSARAQGDVLLARLRAKRSAAEALAMLELAGRRCPRFVPADVLRGEQLLALERRAEARKLFASALAAGDRSPRLLLLTARASLGARADRAAVTKAAALLAQAETALGKTPTKGVARLGGLATAELALARGKAAQAAAALRRLYPRRLPRRPSVELQVVALTLARAHRRGGEAAAAKKVLEQLAQRAPQNAWAQLMLGELALSGGRRERAAAAQHLTRARTLAEAQKRLSPRALARALVGLARLALARKKKGRKEAIALARLAVGTDPELTPAHKLLGGTLLRSKRRKEAAAALERAAAMDPKDASTWLQLARAHRRGAPAKRAYQAFLKLEPRGKRAHKARRALRRLR